MQSALNIRTVLAVCARPGWMSCLTTPALLSEMQGLWPGLWAGARALSLFLPPSLFNASSCEIAQLLAHPLEDGFCPALCILVWVSVWGRIGTS